MSVGMRSPEDVMSIERAAAVMPNALSFSRAAMRRLVRGRWQIEKLRFELDAEGRGEVLYRLHGAGWTFHFFLVSKKLAEEQKTDRNFAQSWDAMGVLCQGEWTAEREAYLRREVPKQRAGYADYDTLIYARGNRSARLFEHVVDRLAEGRQPDAAPIAPVGYILRTTAFIGNGQLGTRPLSGFEPDHPLRLPYHAQFCSAFMLREFIFDLVDHIARARNPAAARLAPAFRRYLGLGNSAATGLVAFVANHPHFMQQWTATCEGALAEALHRPVDDAVAARFEELLAKAIRHFSESVREPDSVFGTPQDLSSELSRLQAELEDRRKSADANRSWLGLREWCQQHLSREATELFHNLVLELYPDLIDAADETLLADERFDLQPDTTAAALLQSLKSTYGWALRAHASDDARYFWYRSSAAPRDVRRGVRGRAPPLEAETCMDTARQIRALHACLCDIDGATPVGEVAVRHPELRHVIARVQSLAALPYAELRTDWLAANFSPFAPIRFALSFFGMEKFEAAPPKSVRGTFMQGAPIAEDVAAGRDGDWPFPLRPAASPTGRQQLLEPLPESARSPDREEATAPHPADRLRIAPGEFARMIQTALHGQGTALGVAEEAAHQLLWSLICRRSTVAEVMAEVAGADSGRATLAPSWPPGGQPLAEFDAQGAPAWSLAPAALDFACACARTRPDGIGTVLLTNIAGRLSLESLAIRSAERGLISLLLWHVRGRSPANGWLLAAPGSDGPWYVASDLAAPSKMLATAMRARIERAGGNVAAGLSRVDSPSDVKRLAEAITAAVEPVDTDAAAFAPAGLLLCIDIGDLQVGDALAAELAHRSPQLRVQSVREMRRRCDLHGITLSRAEFDALAHAGTALLVPREDEPRVLDEGVDPLKVF